MRITEAQIRKTVRGILREGYDPGIFEEDGRANPAFEAAIDKFLPAIVKMLKSIFNKAVKQNPSLGEDFEKLMDFYDDPDLQADDGEQHYSRRDLGHSVYIGIFQFLDSEGEVALPELRFIASALKRLGSMSTTIDVDIDPVGSVFRHAIAQAVEDAIHPDKEWKVKPWIIRAFHFPANTGLIPFGQGEET